MLLKAARTSSRASLSDFECVMQMPSARVGASARRGVARWCASRAAVLIFPPHERQPLAVVGREALTSMKPGIVFARSSISCAISA